MSRYSEIAEAARTLLDAGDASIGADPEEIAAEFAAACAEINVRLGRCARRLKSGRRDEAFALAEEDPKLLDAAAALDIPDREAWDALTVHMALQPAPALNHEAIDALRTACAGDSPLAILVRRHRRLALARAPLRERISVLRLIARAETDDPTWGEELSTYERARLHQIESETVRAAREGDVRKLEGLLEELGEPGWSISPSESLIQTVRRNHSATRNVAGSRIYSDLSERLHRAYSAGDESELRLLRERWRAAGADFEVDPRDPRTARAAVALRWLDEVEGKARAESSYEQAVDGLERDVQGHARLSKLRQSANEVLRHGRGMPEGLRVRFDLRVAEQAAKERKDRRTYAILSGLAAVAVAAGLGLWIRDRTMASDLDRSIAALDRRLELGELDGVAAELERLDRQTTGIASRSALTAFEARLKSAQIEDAKRSREFDSLVREIATAASDDDLSPRIAKAKQQARGDTERSRLNQAIRRQKGAAELESARIAARLKPRIDDVDRRLSSLEDSYDDSADAQNLKPRLEEVALETESIGKELPSSARELRGQLSSLTMRSEDLAKKLDERVRVERADRAIDEALGRLVLNQTHDAAEYAAALTAYAKSFPLAPRSVDYARVAGEAPLWNAATAWGRAVADWGDASLVDPGAASKRAVQCAALLQAHPIATDSAAFRSYLATAEAVARRDQLIPELARALDDGIGRPLFLTRVDRFGAREHYYSFSRHEPNAPQLRIVIDPAGHTRGLALRRDVAAVGDSVPAPHQQIAERFLKSDATAPDFTQHWEARLIDLVGRILADADIDPIIKLRTIHALLTVASKGSVPLEHRLGDTPARLDRALKGAQGVSWMDPQDEPARRARKEAVRVLASLPDLSRHPREAVAERRALEKRIAEYPTIVGRLARTAVGWDCRLPAPAAHDGELVVLRSVPGGSGEWAPVGRVVAGRVHLDRDASDRMADGRPVFLRPASRAPHRVG